MRKFIDEYPYNKKPVKRSDNRIGDIEGYLSKFWSSPVLVLSSARVGYFYALKFLGLKRSDHVLVPDFMCQAILNITNTSGFPVKYPDERTKAVLVFHQWGYPQKMDEVLAEANKRGLVVIEDCAHGFNSIYKGKKVGTFGEAAIFSFAKLFPTYLGGILLSNNSSLMQSVKKNRAQKDTLANKVFNFIARRVAKRSFEKGQARFWLDIIYLKSIHYPNIGRFALGFLPGSGMELETGLAVRKQNYLFLKSGLRREYLISDWDVDIDPNPFLVPVFLPEEKLVSCRKALLDQGVLTDVLHFDVNRNVFAPNYRKCLAVPCHQAIAQKDLEKMVESINAA